MSDSPRRSYLIFLVTGSNELTGFNEPNFVNGYGGVKPTSEGNQSLLFDTNFYIANKFWSIENLLMWLDSCLSTSSYKKIF